MIDYRHKLNKTENGINTLDHMVCLSVHKIYRFDAGNNNYNWINDVTRKIANTECSVGLYSFLLEGNND